jgi:hypothetical protein
MVSLMFPSSSITMPSTNNSLHRHLGTSVLSMSKRRTSPQDSRPSTPRLKASPSGYRPRMISKGRSPPTSWSSVSSSGVILSAKTNECSQMGQVVVETQISGKRVTQELPAFTGETCSAFATIRPFMADYRAAWQEYRRLKKRCLMLFLGYVPAAFSVALISFRLFHSTAPGFVAAGAWMIWWFCECTRLNLWRCPRCGKWFSAKWWYNKGLLARRCVHCGLPKYQEFDAMGSTPK